MLYRAGPVNIYVRIKTRFGLRLSEWMIAVQTLLYGVILLLPYDTFDSSPVYSYARHIVSENVLGGVMAFFGVLRLVGLTVNGARQDITPWIRVVSAGAGFMLFSILLFSFALSGIPSGWIAICIPILVVEIINVYRAAHDVGEYGAHVA
jgi:quinol-cytochrome oxidoreductase complex cytochrome b subunit